MIFLKRGTPSQFLSTLSLRRATRPLCHAISFSADFYPRSPCGERQMELNRAAIRITFLSTLSLRRATSALAPEENPTQFLSTLSLRRATVNPVERLNFTVAFLSTLSLRRATDDFASVISTALFLSTLSLRRATQLLCTI